MDELTHVDLFSGIGGFALSARWAGIKTVQFVELDPFCQKVLKKNFPGVPIHDDIKTFKWTGARPFILTGGFPCQDVSCANNNAQGIEGSRSGLWSYLCETIGVVRPRYALMENVAALLGRGLSTVLRDLSEIGYDAEWHIIPASYVGAFHQRKRIWILAYPKSERLQKIKIQTLFLVEGGPQKPKQWEQFLAIPGGAYHLGERWRDYKSVICGNDDGVSNRVDRLKSLGNAIVPQIAYELMKSILAVEGILPEGLR